MIEHMIINLLVILVPLIALQFVLFEKNSDVKWPKASFLFNIINAGVILVCMSFPIPFADGIFFDLRYVPLTISFLYGGIVPGCMTAALLIIYRLYLGGEGSVTAVFFALVTGWVFFAQHQTFHRLPIRKKLLRVSFILFGITVSNLIFLYIYLYPTGGVKWNTAKTAVYTFYPVLQAGAAIAVVSLIERIRHALNLQLQQSEMLHSVGQLAASVTHEVRNPMAVARGFMQIFQKEKYIPEEKKIFLSMMIEEIDRAQTIISDYLSLVKTNTSKIDRLNITELLSSLKGVMYPFALLKGVELVQKGEEEVHVIGDQGKLKQILMNIIKNAIEATPEGGVVTMSAEKGNGEIIIRISDTGVGMGREQLRMLGNPFFSTKSTGTGLGLMASYRMTAEMNGRIEAASEVGNGTHFKIIFPA
ncbi:two-component system, sporulation sensor kinase B [Fictibacillus solisalsi]|uniref:histidine kinase n=1 Tax=Fictibacillus solisalsi TaxID=459525 RepID=A0A1G9UCG7_9BACL|nr:sensor histidine kinase [Fictibacillus solisalsi]SDM57523.1 two-component system, sporulation sensor kinase B [Fictibacillus solisalsi]